MHGPDNSADNAPPGGSGEFSVNDAHVFLTDSEILFIRVLILK